MYALVLLNLEHEYSQNLVEAGVEFRRLLEDYDIKVWNQLMSFFEARM